MGLEGEPGRLEQDLGTGGGRDGAGRRREGLQQLRLETAVAAVGLGFSPDRQAQLFLDPAAANRQVAVGIFGLEQRGDRLAVIEIIFVFAVRLGLGPLLADNSAPLEAAGTHQLAELLDLGEPLDQDILGPLDGRGGIGKALFLVAEGEGPELEGLPRLRLFGAVSAVPNPVGQRFQPGLFGQGSLGLPLLLIGKIEVFEEGQLKGAEDALAKLRGELLLLVDLLQDVLLALDDLLPFFLGLDHVLDGHLIEVSGLLLAVPRDEGNRPAITGQFQDGLGGTKGYAGMSGGKPGFEIHRGCKSRLGTAPANLLLLCPKINPLGTNAKAVPERF